MITRFEGFHVCFNDFRTFSEFLLDEFYRSFKRTVVDPIDESQHEHIFRSINVLGAQATAVERCFGHFGYINLVQSERIQAAILDWINAIRIFRQSEIFRVKTFGISDDNSTGLKLLQVSLQRSGIHNN